ncbi:MAG: peptidylprolyl isomerase [Candidatus Magasanikbacteria bacterium]|nr:peptidylprolyl isomerase [Candidatus Magasanikbacteria bacterium]
MEKEEKVVSKKVVSPVSLKNKKFFLMGIAGVFVLVFFLSLIFVIRGVYNLQDNTMVRAFSKSLNIPVASINGLNISYYDYIEDIRTLKLFYSQQPEGFPPVSDDDVSNQVLERLLANRFVANFAKENDVEVTDEEVANVKKELVLQFASEEEAEKNLKEKYGWDLDTYTKKIITPIVLEQKVAKFFAESTNEEWAEFGDEEVKARHILFQVGDPETSATVKAQANSILKRVLAGEDFGTLAEEFGSDGTSKTGGDLGWFGRGMMVKEFEKAVYALNVGEVDTNLVETQFGFHIIRLDERRSTRNFAAFLDAKIKEADIKITLPVNTPFNNLQEGTDKEPEVSTETEESSSESES